MKNKRFCVLRVAAAAYFGFTLPAHADVTTEQKTTLDVASLISIHGTSTMSITPDKQRNDSESHCDGMMSLLCGNQHSGEIVRLDRDLTWRLEPDKKRYREEPFATPEQLHEMRAKMQANLEKMRACPVSQNQAPMDKSKCEMSPPKIDVRKTDEKMSIAGHDTERTLVSLTETCTNKETGDVCDTVVALDVWLTQDKLPGVADRQAFQQAYAKKLGLDDMQAMGAEAAKFLAPYQSQMKQLAAKSSDLKGQPLRTSFRMLFGGQQCGSAAKMKERNPPTSGGNVADAAQAGTQAGMNTAQGSVNSAAQQAVNQSTGTGIGGAIAGSAVGASVNKLIGGLFAKQKASSSPQAPSSPAASTNKSDPFPQLVQMAEFTVETVSINSDAIPANRFDIPPDWKKELPKPTKNGNEEFTCPKSGK